MNPDAILLDEPTSALDLELVAGDRDRLPLAARELGGKRIRLRSETHANQQSARVLQRMNFGKSRLF
jgi:ABC-type polar amino acid transport system ATPase subunit